MLLKNASRGGLPLILPRDLLEPQDKQEVCILILSNFDLEIDVSLGMAAHEAVWVDISAGKVQLWQQGFQVCDHLRGLARCRAV